MNSTMTPEQVALGSLPAEILGDDSPITDPKAALAASVSQATRSSRAWNKAEFKAACRAARPHVERELRSRGRAFSSDDVRLGIKTSLRAYADQYGVRLPTRSSLGKTELEVMAGEICGAFSFPWQSFLPPQVKVAFNAAKSGSPKAASWLSKFFGGKSKVAPAPAPLAPSSKAAPAQAPASPPEAPKTASSGSSDSLGSADDSLGAWFHRLNPLYWVKSADERSLIDKERQAWIDNAALQKKLGKREVVLQQGQKAVDARRAVEAAQARAAEIETQLKSIETQLAGACRGTSNLGGEDGYAGRIARVSTKNVLSLEKGNESFVSPDSSYDAVVGEKGYAGRIASVSKKNVLSLEKGSESFVSPDSSYDAVVGDKENPFTDVAPADAAPVLSKIKRARSLNENNIADLAPIAAKLRAGLPLSPDDSSKVLLYLARNEQLHEFRKRLVSGDSLSGNPSKNKISRHVVLGAVKAMTPTEQQMLSQLTTLAKQGNPHAIKGLALLRAQGYATTASPPSTSMGSLISDTFNVVKSAVALPFKAAYQGTKWVARKTGITKGGSSPEQVRMARLRAAAKRRQAAAARARAADAQSEAEYRVQQQMAAAAQAEADAADAEATAREASMLTAESEHTPLESDDASGAAGPVVTPLPPTPALPSAETFKASRRRAVARKNPKAARILAASETQTPAGVKLRASMQLYKGALKPKSKERKAVEAMVAKAKAGDKQAISDVNALKAAGIALKAEKKAGRLVAVSLAYKATVAKARAAKARAEVALGDRLARASRSRELSKVAKIERRAAAGDKKCLTFVKTHVAKAKAGDPRSKKVVDAIKLVRAERLAAPNRRERRNLAQGRKLVQRASRGDKLALAKIRVIEAAAAHGNPNAVRAKKRLQTAAARELTLKHGVIVVPGVVITASKAKKKTAKARATVARAEQKIASGTATREEAMAASKAAADTGDRVKSGELAAQAASLPSAKDSLQKVAPVLAAASAGNPQAAEAIERASQQAARGEPRGIETMGKVAAVKAMNDVSQGRTVEPEMQAAARDVEAAQAGDTVAKEKLTTMQAQAKEGVPEAVKYAVYASGAAAVSRALAASPQAKVEWQQRVGVAPPDTSREDVQVVSPRAPAPSMLAASALMVPAPYEPLPPIRDFLGLLGAAVRALTLTTRHPFQNHREGLLALASKGAPDESAGEEAVTETEKENRKKVDRLLTELHANTLRKKLVKRAERGDQEAKQLLAELDKRVPLEKKVTTSLLGDVPGVEDSPSFKTAVSRLREKLSEARQRAAAGHAPSAKLLQKAKDDFVASTALSAQKNDAGATLRVKLYRASGLFGKS